MSFGQVSWLKSQKKICDEYLGGFVSKTVFLRFLKSLIPFSCPFPLEIEVKFCFLTLYSKFYVEFSKFNFLFSISEY
jgi:hypothetical protein